MASIPTNSPQEQASAISGKPLLSCLLTFSLNFLNSNLCLAFADELQQQLLSSTASSGALAITDDALRTLDGHLEQLPLYRTDLPISTRHQLDLKGTEVWNTCVQLMATCGDAERGLLSKGIWAFFKDIGVDLFLLLRSSSDNLQWSFLLSAC